MINDKRNISMIVLVYAGLVSFLSAGTSQHKSGEKPPSTWELIRKSKMKRTKSDESASTGRVIHFPKERSLGQLMIQDADAVRNIQTFFYWTEVRGSEWEYLAEARGDIIVPAGKRLALVINEYGWRDLSGLSRLKPDDLYKLNVPGPYPDGPKPDDRIMPYIARLVGLKSLGFGNTNISAQGLKLIGNLDSLEQLYAPRLTDAGLAEVARLSSLKALYIYDHNLTNAGLAHLARLELLEELDLIGKGRLNDAGLVHLAKLPCLRYLLLQGKNFTDDGMAQIKNCSSLRILHLGHLTQLTDAAVLQLSQMPELERLSFHWNENITNASMMYLKKMNSLKMLDIKHSKVTDEGLVHLAQIESLENLTLPDGYVTDAGIEHIAKLHNLKYLWAGSPLTDKSLFLVSTLGNLEELHIGGTGFSDEGMKHIAELTKLKCLSIFTADQLTNKGLAELSGMKSLTNFSLGRRTRVSVSGLKSLNNFKNLNKLSLHDIRQDTFIMDISGLTELKDLTIVLHEERKGDVFVSDSFKNEDWACLSNLTKLKRLQITGVGIDNEGVKHLSGLTNLEFLNIFCPGESKINDQALKYLRNMHKLNRLYIKDGHFTDKALDYLDGLPALSWLELTSDFAFSTKAIQDFQQKNPKVTKLQLMP
jgi:Leucine-rich repeat (LRR) protein